MAAVALHAAPVPGPGWLAPAAWALVGAYLVATLVMVFGPHRVGDVFTETDFYGSYGPGARALQEGRLDPSRYGVVGPLFEILLAAAGFVVRDLFLAAELIAAASMTAALAFWWSLVARRVGPGAAFLTALFLASNAQFFRYGWSATTDAPALALQAAALWALLGARRREPPAAGPAPESGEAGSAAPGMAADGGPTPAPEAAGAPTSRRLLAAGLLAGLAFLTRYNSVALLPAALAAIALGWAGVPAGARLRAVLWVTGGFLLPVLPWVAYSASHGGAVRFQLHHNIAYEVFARPKGIVWDHYARDLQPQFPTPWSVLARDPMAVLGRMAFNVLDHLRLDARVLAGLPLACAAAAGVWLAWRDGALLRIRPVLLAMAFLFLALVPAFHSERYSLAVLPGWALLGAVAFASPWFALAAGRVWWKLALVPAVLLPALGTTRAFTARVVDQLPVEVLDAARQVRPYVRPGEKVMARKPHFAWYAGLTSAPLPLADSLADWGESARREGARWLYFSWPEAELRPRFEWLLDSTSAAPGLTVRAATARWPALVYEIGPRFGDEPDWITNDTLVAVHRARARVLVNHVAVEPRVFLAMHELSLRNFDAAQRHIDELLQLTPSNPEVLLMAADNRLQLGDPAGALEYYARLDAIRPGTAEARVGRGWAAALQGDEVGAARLWATVVGATDDPNTLRRMGVAFARTGDGARLEEVRVRMKALGLIP
jgi:4-amino-4-deoxy-L-arabinose transferase-like glycosyltransferase